MQAHIMTKKTDKLKKLGRPKKPEGEKKVTRSPKPSKNSKALALENYKEPKEPHRPEILFTEEQWSTIEELCRIHCTSVEIASVMGVSNDTLVKNIRKDYGLSFPEYFEQKAGYGRASLRRRQWQTADNGNPTMQIWLGKQYLGQSEPKSD